MANTNVIFKFEQGGGIYESTESGRFFYTNPMGKKSRIGRLVFDAAFKQFQKHNSEEAQAKQASEETNYDISPDTWAEEVGKENARTDYGTKPKTKKTKPTKPRAKKVQAGGMEFDHEGVKIILTPKQVDFIKHLPDTCFWENGTDSQIWVDCLCDEIGGQFAARPMTVGAMISTLCEKGLGARAKDRINGRRAISFRLTELGQKIAKELGL